MKKTVLAIVSISFCILACNKNNENVTNISSTGSNKSHNMGQNCMNCHTSGGKGEGIFKAAGTVYNAAKTATLSSGTVYLYTGPNSTGSLKATIAIDAKGNFYTTESIDFSGGLYPSIQGATTKNHMSTSISTGQCNSCHNNTTDKLWAQ